MFGKQKLWAVTETSYPEGRTPCLRVVEQDLTARRARRSVDDWQDASDRNREMVTRLVGADKVPTVIYRAELLASLPGRGGRY